MFSVSPFQEIDLKCQSFQEWPDEVEESLGTLSIPTAELDADLATQVSSAALIPATLVFTQIFSILHKLATHPW